MTEPIYRQLADYITGQILDGVFLPDKPLPSLNAMAIASGLSKKTVVKAYDALCKDGVVNSIQGKGFFIRKAFLSGRPSVMVLLDKLSPHQQSALDGISGVLAEHADITIRMHYQNVFWFESELDEVLDKYDWYLVFPHFGLDTATREKAGELLSRIPPRKLIVLDRLIDGISEESGASYQSIEQDIPSTLSSAIEDIRKYSRIRYLSLSVSLYGNIVADVIRNFCNAEALDVEVLPDVPAIVNKGDLFFVSGSRLDKRLSALIKIISSSGFQIGKDVGLICYNDFPLNEYILGGLTTLSVDFTRMGRNAAEMILSGNLEKIHCKCSLIRRSTF